MQLKMDFPTHQKTLAPPKEVTGFLELFLVQGFVKRGDTNSLIYVGPIFG